MDEGAQEPGFGAMSQLPVVTIGPPPGTRGNRPLVIIAVIGLVAVSVLWTGIIGKLATTGHGTIKGEAVAAATAPVRVVPPPDTDPGPTTGTPAKSTDIAANSLLVPGAALARVDCSLPRLGRGTSADLTTFYQAAIDCLDRAWRPVVEAATGGTFPRPKLDVSDNPTSGCGPAPADDDVLAFYCDYDDTIYMPRARLLESAGTVPAYHIAVLAHEYGHHVQGASGILRAASLREFTADEDELMEISRRTELQANCFAGLFLAAAKGKATLTNRVVADALDSFSAVYNSDSHGSARNQGKWAKAGLNGDNTASCNTWSATTADVE
ncbi:neutral zinc metallopeptidase [Actinokineospora enzanensis]|uniref:neutral zinc metallopeptidase n=1 Tax=Actinokineospora enzanensis TaxID=155975 RepID=UPI00035F60FB|nr:neutral zinc metallopeptidase [Actinokineospora enzanensis]